MGFFRNPSMKWFTFYDDETGEPDPGELHTFTGKIIRFLAKRTNAIKSLSANFTPIQSGSGDPSPDNIRPITGHDSCQINVIGENLCDLSTFTNGYVTNTGSINTTHSQGEQVSPFIEVDPSTTYRFQIISTTTNYSEWFGIGRYSSNNASSFISRTTVGTFTTTAETHYVRLSARNLEGATAVVFYKTSDNIKKEIPLHGKQLFDVSTATVYGRYLASDNSWKTSSNSASYAVPCYPNTTYTVSCDNDNLTIFRVAYIISLTIPNSGNITAYGLVDKTSDGSITITTGDAATFLVIQLNAAYISTSNLQVEFGDTASPYEVYSGAVYSGTLTVNEDGSGSIVATMAMKTISDLDFTSPYSVGTVSESVFRSAVVDEMQAACDPMCSAYKTKAWGETIQNLGDYQIQTGKSSSTQQQIFIKTKDYNENTLSDWKSAFGNQQVVYPLATPVTIPLTASQINTLVGNNVVWVADADGDITVIAYGTPVGEYSPIVGTGQAGHMII